MPARSTRRVPLEWRNDLLAIVALGTAVRIALALVYQPQSYPDTGTYFELARRLQDLPSLMSYGGQRTPGYPLLLLLAGLNPYLVWFIQALLGIVVSLLSYWIVVVASGNRIAALLAAVVHSIALNQLFFEANLLTETLATFVVTLSVVLFAFVLKSKRPVLPAWLGFVCSIATLTRPTYIVLAPVYGLLLLAGLPRRCKLHPTFLFCAAFLVPVLIWASVNKLTAGQFSLTTLLGYSLSNHAGGFFELVPEKDRVIRDIYLKHRTERIAESPSHTYSNTAIRARDELLRATGLSPIALSNELARISLQLFEAHPLRYAKSVFEAWLGFWAVPNYWNAGEIEPAWLSAALVDAWKLQQILLRIANLAFVLVASAWLVTLAPRWRRLDGPDLVGVALVGVVLASSLLQAAVEFGDNPRFGIPTQPLVICFLSYFVASRTARRHAPPRRS
jgi:hypothetical protein